MLFFNLKFKECNYYSYFQPSRNYQKDNLSNLNLVFLNHLYLFNCQFLFYVLFQLFL